MCETRDLGIKWLCWHALVFSNEITIDKDAGSEGSISTLEEVGSQARI